MTRHSLTFKCPHMNRQVTLCTIHIISWRLPSHQAWVIVDKPVSHFALRWHHFCMSWFLTIRSSLSERKFSYVVFYLYFTGSTIIKFNGERGMTLYNRGYYSINILCWDLMDLCFWRFWWLLKFFSWNLKVTWLSPEGKHRLFLGISISRNITIQFLFMLRYLFWSFYKREKKERQENLKFTNISWNGLKKKYKFCFR